MQVRLSEKNIIQAIAEYLSKDVCSTYAIDDLKKIMFGNNEDGIDMIFKDEINCYVEIPEVPEVK